MIKKSKILIPQRKRFFLGCEGDSEQAYGALLSRLLEKKRRDIHLHVVNLRGGDAYDLVRLAGQKISESKKKGEPPYLKRALLLDSDTTDSAPEKLVEIVRFASTLELRLIWQSPCHEALLLKHLVSSSKPKPKTSDEALDRLLKVWNTYRKGSTAAQLMQRISVESIERAAGCEPELKAFLEDIGFLHSKIA